jgi:hypothetical protein
MQTLLLQRIGDNMLEDLLELRRILDRFIAKYQEQDRYRFEHDPRIVEDIRDRDTYTIHGDDRLTDIGKELLKLKEKESNDGSGEQGSPTEWRGNDIY